MNLMQTCIAGMMGVLKGTHGSRCTYHSLTAGLTITTGADGQPLTLLPIRTGTDAEVEELVESEIVRSVKIQVVDLPFLPQRDDEVKEIDANGVEQHYQVLKTSSSREAEPDNFGIYHIIHLKQVHGPHVDQSVIGNADGLAYGNQDGTAYASSDR